MRAEWFLQVLQERLGIDFYTGVPDSQLKPLCDVLYRAYGAAGRHLVAPNEGAAVALAAGHYIAAGKPAMVYLQNSGLGNAVNPITSLLHEKVYGIPCLFVVGWRGEPGVKDEPQHLFQGEITPELMELLDLTTFTLSSETTADAFLAAADACQALLQQGKSAAFLIRKNTFEQALKVIYPELSLLRREQALSILLSAAGHRDVFVTTTGKTSREVYELREQRGETHERDFLTVGSMGHALMIALGIAREKPGINVWCLDGDGAMLMHLGSMVVAASSRCGNLTHVVLNNGAHESVGGMPVNDGRTDFCALAKAAGYRECAFAENEAEWKTWADQMARKMPSSSPRFVEVLLSQGSRENLGRPATTPKENLAGLMAYLRREEI